MEVEGNFINLISLFKNFQGNWVLEYTPVIPEQWEAEEGGFQVNETCLKTKG